MNNFTQTDSGLWVPRKVRTKRTRPIAIDFFAGAGGFSLGIKQAGFDVIAAFDSDCAATVTYTRNLGAYPMEFHFATEADAERMEKWMTKEYVKKDPSGVTVAEMGRTGDGYIATGVDITPTRHFFFGDIRKWTGEGILKKLGLEKGEVDLVFGGPPCQGFSTAGKQNVMDPRNSLVFEFARFIVDLQPKTFCMENVPGIINMVTPEGLRVIDQFCLILEEGGFGTVDALKRTLIGNPKARAAIRTKKVESAKDIEQEDEEESESLQMEMAL
jgi:DNA (cytosine-5)-methyltransferase 1